MDEVAGSVAPVRPFSPGDVAVRRDVLRGRVWSATAYRVIDDSGTGLVLGCWPGAQLLAPTTWIDWLRTGDDDVRQQALPNLASGQWDLAPWIWTRTTLVTQLLAGDFFSVNRYIDPGQPSTPWYVNFELPYRRTLAGVDTFDVLLDLVIDEDLSGHRWKDEDEYAQARRLGIISDRTHQHIDQARAQVLALATARQGPFARDLATWRPPAGWTPPTLPPAATATPDPNTAGVSRRSR
ncbi:MAG: DUF402 domain-containing protein [Kineosporiaceae bacterium]